MTHCEMFQTEEIQTIVGDASRDGVGSTQYCGLWSLTSKYRVFNAFGNSYAGLIPGEIRGKAPVLEVLDDHTAILSRKADETRPVDVQVVYELKPPFYIDHRLTFTDHADARAPDCDFRELSWCSYMNCPDDISIHFLSGGGWIGYASPRHGVESNIAPSWLTDDQLERWPEREKRPFHWDRAPVRFDRPFYYGRLGNMALIFIFDTPDWLRFFHSPSGGGPSLIPGRTCPAWDFEWIIPASAYEVNREYTLRMRLVYKQFISEDDVIREAGRAADELA